MDLLREQEVIRNEALLLLIALSRSDEEIQKIIAFEGAFDVLFEIMTEEGYVQGGIIVQDSLVLLNNLLRNNPSNQLMFREAGYIANLHRLLFLDADIAQVTDLTSAARVLEDRLRGETGRGESPPALSTQAAANLLCALEMVLILTTPVPAQAPGDSDSAAAGRHEMAVMCNEANHTLLAKSATLNEVLSLSLLPGCDGARPVRVMALRCAARLVSQRQAAQDRLSSGSVAVRGHTVPVLQVTLCASQCSQFRRYAGQCHIFRKFHEESITGDAVMKLEISVVRVQIIFEYTSIIHTSWLQKGWTTYCSADLYYRMR